jgi:hypothetical protein
MTELDVKLVCWSGLDPYDYTLCVGGIKSRLKDMGYKLKGTGQRDAKRTCGRGPSRRVATERPCDEVLYSYIFLHLSHQGQA